MTRLQDILSPSFKAFRKPHPPMVQPTADSDFCQEVVARGWLTAEQMEHAARRYRLGRSRSGKTIFWMTDDMMIVRDGRIGDRWVSQMLKAREPRLLKDCYTEHCLFGLHLLAHTTDSETIGVVESMRSCIVLSERFPKYLWMATGYLSNLNERLFLPLKGCHVVCFPPTDQTRGTYLLWLTVAEEARKYGIDITVSRFLEDNATPEQKAREIDLVGFLFDNIESSSQPPYPPCPKEDLEPLSKSPANRWRKT